ncbi:MAG TPA: heme o synthase [Bacteroidota bacterium]|nr:heme o synthase [Bacteroidota bacterium]
MSTHLTPPGALALERTRVADYLALTKPELTFLSVLTSLAGYMLGSAGTPHAAGALALALGTAMVGGGSGALNQAMERKFDALMKRTEQRPLPSGRIGLAEAVIFGILLVAGGLLLLATRLNAVTASLAAVTCATYLLLYTPLKRLTPMATLIGAFPGAIPPVMGWTAAAGVPGAGAFVLFGILFLWQMPHFLSLAWIYRNDYAKGGYRLLAVTDADGKKTGVQSLSYAVALVPVSLLLAALGEAGPVYALSALVLGGVFAGCAAMLLVQRTGPAARRLFIASLVYLPLLMIAMAVDRFLGS